MDDKILDDKSRSEIPVDSSILGSDFSARQEPGWKKILKNKAVVFSSLGALTLILLIGWFFLWRGNATPTPTSNSVVLLIKGPSQITSGNEAEYSIVYRNGENADMISTSLEMFYPSGFRFKSANPVATSSSGHIFNLPILKQGESREIIVRGKLEGSTGEEKLIKAVLHYSLSNFNSQFVVEETFRTGILPPNLTMDINGPVDVVNGQDTTFSVSFTNVTIQDFDNLAVSLTYPEGFSFTSSKPGPSKNNNYWTLPKLASNSSASIEITGSFSGDTSEEKLVKADLGQMINNVFAPQITSTATFRIIPSSLTVVISSDHQNTVKLGDTINYTLKYQNQGNIGLENIIITVKLEGPALELSRISAQNAIVAGTTLTWKAATLPGLSMLSPNEKGEITFSVPVKSTLNTNLKNQTINISASIASDEITKAVKASDLSLKLASVLNLTVNGEYVSGSLPMKVNQTTLFAMTFALSDLSNDLSNTQVIASLPLPSSAWKNVIIPEAEKSRLRFDSNSGKITWTVGDLPAFTGKFTPVLRVTFQLQITPSESDRGKTINLLSNIQATGLDNFINETLQTDPITLITTSDIDDDTLNSSGTTVE